MIIDITQNLRSVVCSCLNSYWAFHLFPLLIFFQLVAFCTEFNLFTPHLFCSFYDNGFPLCLWSPSGLLCWWIFIVNEMVLNLVSLSIFSGLAALMNGDIAKNLWSLFVAVLTANEHFIYSHFLFFLKLVAFCSEFNAFPPLALFSLW